MAAPTIIVGPRPGRPPDDLATTAGAGVRPGGPRRCHSMAHDFRLLFTPLRLGPVTAKSRIFSSGHAEALADDGKPGPRLCAYHEAKARGGAALTIIGGSTSVHPSSPAAEWNLIANHDDTIIPAYRTIARAVHRHQCLVFTQLTHLGRR